MQRKQWMAVRITPDMTREEFNRRVEGWSVDLSFDDYAQAAREHGEAFASASKPLN